MKRSDKHTSELNRLVMMLSSGILLVASTGIMAILLLATGCAPHSTHEPRQSGGRHARGPAPRTASRPAPRPVAEAATQFVTLNGTSFEVDSSYVFFTWADLPWGVDVERQPIKSFSSPEGETHAYEVVYVPSGNLNWYQAAYLAEDAGGYLACITSHAENDFVFGMVNDDKYFWHFPPYDGTPGRMNHYEISIGPFLGGYQARGAAEPDGGWRWLSGERWEYANWAKDLGDGVIDKDPRNNSQPNDSGNAEFGQRVMGFGEMNKPVPTWGDYMDDVGTYGMDRTPGRAYAFIIEYDARAD